MRAAAPKSQRSRNSALLRRIMAAALLACSAASLTAFDIVTPSTAAAAESIMFNISGRGYGHGIGMSQYGAYGYARHGWTYRDILKHYYTGISFGSVPNSTVRVLLADRQSSVRVSASTRFRIISGSRKVVVPGSTRAVVTYSSGAYRVTAGTKKWTFREPVLLVPIKSRLLLANRNQNGWSTSANIHYRGSLRLIRFTGGLSIINVVRLEDYLCGVVPREMPSGWHAEALKAQAVAARSYAAMRVGSGGAFDLYCTTRSQAYNGSDYEAASTNAAVRATRGVVPKYAGRPISAYFFSTSGGYTENIENVWHTSPVPYLKGVEDKYDDVSPYHIWPENPLRRPASAIVAALGSAYSPGGALQTIYVTKRGVSRRVVTAYAVGTGGTRALSGATLRVRLGLRDTWFSVRTLSMNPSNSPRTTILYGATATLKGRTFPALVGGQKLVLHTKATGGVWRSSVVPPASITPGSLTLPGGRAARYSAYNVSVEPAALTSYYFSVGTARSPQTSIAVRPVVELQPVAVTANVGDVLAFNGMVTPVALAGTTVTLQVLNGDTWTAAGTSLVGADGACTVSWTAESAGSYTFRLRVPAAKGMAVGLSEAVTVTVSASPAPSPSPSL